MLGLIPLKDWLYLGAIAALMTGFLFYRHSLIVDGERIKAAAQVKAAADQKARDDLVAKGVIDDLNTQIGMLSNAALTGVPNIPGKLRIIRQVPASGSPAETSGSSTGPGGVGGVPEGTQGGTDCWPVVSDLALAGGVEAAYLRSTREWAMKQGKD